jgi:hypothetical protein
MRRVQSEQGRDDGPAAAGAAQQSSARAAGGSSAPAPAPVPAPVPVLGPVARSGPGFLRIFGCRGSSQGQFNGPRSMAWDLQGNVVVADEMNNRLQVIQLSDGACLRTIGSNGSGAG